MANTMWLETFGLVDSDVIFFVFCAVTGITAILGMVNIFMGCCIKGMSPGSSMDFYVALGAILIDICVLIQGLNTSWADESQFETLCELYPTALMIGFTMFIGALMVKAWAIFAYAKWNAQNKAPITEEWKPNIWMWLLIIITGVCVVVWTVVFDITLIRSTALTTEDNVVYACHHDNQYEWQVALSVWHAFLLLMALISVIANCCVGKVGRDLAWSPSFVILNTVAVVVTGLCVYYLTDIETDIQYAIYGALLLWMCLFANLMALITKSCSMCDGNTNNNNRRLPDENYDTIKSDNSSKGHDNMTFQNQQFEPEGDNFTY